MPLTKKGQKIMSSMKKEYGSKQGKSVFYASRNAGKIKGVDRGFYSHSDVKTAAQSNKGVTSYGIGCEMCSS